MVPVLSTKGTPGAKCVWAVRVVAIYVAEGLDQSRLIDPLENSDLSNSGRADTLKNDTLSLSHLLSKSAQEILYQHGSPSWYSVTRNDQKQAKTRT